ncbi:MULTISPECIES: (2Fe-2S)-binding protein [unclassified Mesorhizobium]|uniref:(2Fe-2S)-binding protein n=1 Tax=unclassified Mesorhizobium TaxID=325217 RepID=UPI000FD95906|nr:MULTISPECIES: (2Fe-2S)-binding protein [unclassified Mesorhizobium]TGQ31038.1 (2Fe-2S)-binding protein [Mesorhizobium sp. M00.F.Ca.ET.216.01.1.1]TIS55674.1 MAG: (2Fe-2S)-binding protein [Mesorhizobium sp.]TIS86743.1 MAG: (2Fe-2S)-binding protein [Mesorhizobium sp.]TJW06349.1 MAG: (2Fe-2S)-binding protein [Mesorhizobium sp.]TJW45882.1 MAG: (2Fe-2S)-binding protein [Mesorhizobium sp.]
MTSSESGRFRRVGEQDRPRLVFSIDGQPAEGCKGDTLLVAMLTQIRHLRSSEFGDGDRAGFCLMGACQDCWVWTDTGERLRACTTPLAAGMCIATKAPEQAWPTLA